VGAELRVVATAGHVDHGKSALIARLTGMDPDRWAEEKRRGLTIDLGYAWCTLPSGREVGFVDVPGHERFIGNMLAGVGPVRLVLFIVAADEGWARQSEEHLQILDVLGVQAGVVALTKRDLVDAETLAFAEEEVRERLAGTALARAPIVAVSSATGEGFGELVAALDVLLKNAPIPETARPRLFADRVFSIKGAGTVVTGTLTGDRIAVGDEVELYPTGERVRIRSLQSHKQSEEQALPVVRVAANLVGIEREALDRGMVVGRPGDWRPTLTFEGTLRPIRGLEHPVTSRGAFKVYAGAAEAEAKLRLYGPSKLEPGGESFVRLTLSRPLVLDVGDRFVLRESGRHETVGGGEVLDVAPPAKPGAEPARRLAARAAATRDDLPDLLVSERGAATASDALLLTGSPASGGAEIGDWFVSQEVLEGVERDLSAALARHHQDHPLEEGADLAFARSTAVGALQRAGAPGADSLADALLESLTARGITARDASTIRLAEHHVHLGERSGDVERLLDAIGGATESTPPSIPDLVGLGIGRDVIDAAVKAGTVVQIAPELVITTSLAERAGSVVGEAGDRGITVSAFREALGTTRKYAVPMLEWMDKRGITRREGDRRIPRAN
jgi:selenocysteine-specific elongation factor